LKHSEYNDDPIEFLSILARKGGRLLRGGEPDVDGVAKMVLNDFLRGKIPWFTPPPKNEGQAAVAAEESNTGPALEGDVVSGRKGQLGEMGTKVKVDSGTSITAETDRALSEASVSSDGELENEFEAFSDESDEPSDAESEDDGANGAPLES
jgi:nuclear GTP-binding protein